MILSKDRKVITEKQEDCNVKVFQFIEKISWLASIKLITFQRFYKFFKPESLFLINNVKFFWNFSYYLTIYSRINEFKFKIIYSKKNFYQFPTLT